MLLKAFMVTVKFKISCKISYNIVYVVYSVYVVIFVWVHVHHLLKHKWIQEYSITALYKRTLVHDLGD